jgi:hypothetical protein
MAKSKQGQSVSQISQLTELTINEVKETLGQATGLTPKEVSIVFRMKHEGYSLDQISQEYDVELEVLEKFLPRETTPVIKETVAGYETQIDALFSQGKRAHEIGRVLEINERAVLAYTLEGESKAFSEASERAPIPFMPSPTTTEEAKQLQSTQTLPKRQPTPAFLYYYQERTNNLHRVNLLTREMSCHEVPHYQFKSGCRWSELLGGSLLITGGHKSYTALKDVVRLDVETFGVSPQPPMPTARYHHAAVYHSQYLYVLGGLNDRYILSECERYSCAENRWQVLPALRVAGAGMSVVEVENSVYALGGSTRSRALDTVQKLSLDSLTWQLMQLKLPQTAHWMPCFKADAQVYLVIKETLYSFTPLQVKAVKTLPESIGCYSSSYSRGTLYYECDSGIDSLELGI